MPVWFSCHAFVTVSLDHFGSQRVLAFLVSEAATIAQDNHIYTSGATGTNAAVIRGALRAEKPHLLTVVLPQSRSKQPPESQELLEQVNPPRNNAGRQIFLSRSILINGAVRTRL